MTATTDPVAACKKCCVPFDNHADAATHISTECNGELVTAAEEIRDLTVTRTPMSDNDSEITVEDFAQIGSHEFSVNVRTNNGLQTVVVDLFNGDVNAIGPNPSGLENDHQRSLLADLTAAVPETPDQPFTFVKATATANGDGNGGGGGSSGSADDDGDDGFNGDVVSAPGDTDYDGAELEENVDEWLSNYAQVKNGMIDGGWHVEFGTITDPNDGSSELGVHIDVAPFYAPDDVWDSQNSTWANDDAQDEFADHREAMKGIFKDDSEPVELVVNEDEDYGWYNYVPADDAADL